MDEVTVRIGAGVADFARDEWDACAGTGNPFVSWDFLVALERSGSVGGDSGWQPLPVVIDGADGRIAAAAPAYGKSHSQGEYVFDHGWADAWARAGGRYYPKIQVASPFSPVPGPRLLLRDPAQGPALIAGIEALVERHGLSSAHATFVDPEQVPLFEAAGWLIREDSQFHWTNRGYDSFEDFLADLSSEKRKNIRKERRRAVEGLEIVHLSGAQIGEAHWDIFWQFYQDTGARKWGHPYLTREAFDLMGARMANQIILLIAYDSEERPVAGALHFLGNDTLYGRYWGCLVEIPYLHFELCYYRAIDIAIARGLARVEAGAQGGHKLARGYGPVATWSAHFIADPGFRRAVADYLEQERRAEESEMEWLEGHTPFKRTD